MGRDILGVYQATTALLKKVPAGKFSSFVLTTYLAKGSTYAINSYSFRTSADFLNALQNTVISPGASQQPTISALRDALSKEPLTRPKSTVFVFTDAPSANASAFDPSETATTDESAVVRSAIHWGLRVR
uniref:VWFA domain-containing protein n=1 Tax=Steinernema glaseri TaxID=37863 RepID=A0A1I7YW88_9BILA